MKHAPHIIFDISPCEPVNICVFVAFERTHASPHRLCVNILAPKNMNIISVTRDTSHFDRSVSKYSFPAKTWPMLITRETSHSAISPCESVEQSPTRERWTQSSIARLRSYPDSGAKTVQNDWFGQCKSEGNGYERRRGVVKIAIVTLVVILSLWT